MKENPFYHMFRYAFWDLGYNREGEDYGLFDGSPVATYADTVVQDLFALHIPEIESSAALVMNVWMASVNGVFQAMTHCRNHDPETGLAALDKAVALWVGAGQEEGSNEKGHLLYNLAENAGELFDQDVGETEVNRKVIDGFAELQTALQSGSCDKDATNFTIRYSAVRSTVYWLTGIMTVPLIQNLIHHTVNIDNEGGSNMVELYSLGIIPRVATCDPRSYDYLLKLDVLNDLREEDGDKAIEALQRVYSCLGFTCNDVGSYMGGEIPACVDVDTSSPFLQGGYTATSKGARSISRIDRDILQIDAFMKYNAKDLALDWYKNGWNSELSLHTLAMHNFVPELSVPGSSYFSIFADYNKNSEYYQGSDFLNQKITNILTNADNTFREGFSSSEQIRSAVTGFLQYSVMFVTIADSLKYAASQCRIDAQAAKTFVDASAMFFVGSMADAKLNSSGYKDGKSLFVMAQELCNDFGTCIKSGESAGAAVISDLVITSLSNVAEALDNKNCDEVDSLVEITILPALSVPLIQGLLKQASYNEDLLKGSDDAGLATGDVLSRAILPLVSKISPPDADIILVQMEYGQSTQPVADGFKSVADAFRGDTLSDMGIGCALVGAFVNEPAAGATCGDGVTPTVSSEVSSGKLGFGRYKFVDVDLASNLAAFALDVRDMFIAFDPRDATAIYTDGANALAASVFGENRHGLDYTPSLASLSTLAGRVMYDDPLFNIYKYALYDDSDFEDSSDETFSFANDIVIEALNQGDDMKLAAEATVILQVFHSIANRLYESVRICDSGISPLTQLDSAVALWIGDQQGDGKFDDGWMMYSIAQSVEKFFGFPEGESPVNAILMNLFVQAQTAAFSCNADKDASTKTIRFLSHEIIRLLTQPLIQSLLFHMVQDSKNMVELYAVAVLPQCAACDPQAYNNLQLAFFSGYDQATSLTDEVLDDLAIFLRCQRITCENIQTGSEADVNLKNLVDNLCDRLGKDPNTNLPIAGYVPQFPVYEEARLDLDALEVDIMMKTRAYGAAEDVYKYGHNSGASRGATLHSLSAEAAEKISAGDTDDMIMPAIRRAYQYSTVTRGGLAEIVRRCLQSIVSYNAVLVKMQSSIDSCESGAMETARQEWDTAVALFVGSIEGILAGGEADRHGVMMYALGNEFCEDFGTCETSGEATVNEQLISDFTSGKASMVDGECEHLKTVVSESITPKLLIPHIQGLISSTIKINNDLGNNAELLATVHVLSQTVIPIVGAQNSASGTLLSQNYGTSLSTVSRSPAVSDIVNVFGGVLDGLGIPCDAIGNPAGYSLCTTGTGGSNSGSNGGDPSGGFVGYIPKTHVEDRAKIALDVKDMSEALSEGNNELAQLIYRKGKNSEKFDENGKFVRTRNLKWFSTTSTNDMFDEPEFNMFMYTLGNQMYADDLVEEALKNSKFSNPDVAPEAVMVLNLWMEIVHLMHDALQGCKNKQLKDDDGVFLMDAAVAYWTGAGQIAGDEGGDLLYALAERFGQTFNIENAGQSRTNTNILRLFNEAKNEVSLPNACSDGEFTYTKLRGIVNRLIPLMTVPLIQGLILSLRANDRERVKIYSYAYVPLVAGCSPSLFESLKQKFFSAKEYNVIEVESIIDMIRQSYYCLGLQCDDIGVLDVEEAENLPGCKDRKIDANLAGYRPASDVREVRPHVRNFWCFIWNPFHSSN
jgi:hypothetical protein